LVAVGKAEVRFSIILEVEADGSGSKGRARMTRAKMGFRIQLGSG
jgi:hypothetical protein